jgi:hypothetical protein
MNSMPKSLGNELNYKPLIAKINHDTQLKEQAENQ